MVSNNHGSHQISSFSLIDLPIEMRIGALINRVGSGGGGECSQQRRGGGALEHIILSTQSMSAGGAGGAG